MSAALALTCLHGFAGRPDDFRTLGLGDLAGCPTVTTPDLFAAGAEGSLPELADRLNAQRAAAMSRPGVLIGYSLGGRVALHMLIRAPRLWWGAVLVSTHPGLASAAERIARRAADEAWARRFETDDEPWPDLLAAWNSQPVFGGSPIPPALARPETPGLRARLARSLRRWSLAGQSDLRPAIARLERPILWVSGERDARFTALAEEMRRAHILSEAAVVSGAGHRVPWESPARFGARLESFLAALPRPIPFTDRDHPIFHSTDPRGEIFHE